VEETEFYSHIQNIDTNNGCQAVSTTPSKGITRHVWAKIKEHSRKNSRKLSDKQQWLEIYHLLFPEDPEPTSARKMLSRN